MSRTACFTRRIINQLLLLSTFKEFYNTGMLKYSLTISYLGAGQLGLYKCQATCATCRLVDGWSLS